MASKKQQDLENVPEAIIEYADLSDDCKELATTSARFAFLGKSKGEIMYWKDCAEQIKKEFDTKMGITWHCITGTHFGSYVSHECKNIIFFSVGEMKVLLWKHG
mmetsp:Transcript_35748/g.70182  ORF Transcript_35748/g.70182 Transcript_35748/m.70182 type:complete len:104 (+) Transcript_35748:33-344(+)